MPSDTTPNCWSCGWLTLCLVMMLSSGLALADSALVGNSTQSTATERNNARLIARDNQGTLHTVYYDDGIVHSYSTDGAQSWSTPPTRITNIGRNPSLATGGIDGLDLVYKRGGTLAFEIVHRSYNGTWSEETVVYNSPQIAVSRPVLAVDSAGDLHCVWQKSGYGATPNAEIWYCKRTDGSWGAAMNASNTYGASEYPTLTIDADDNVHVFWKDSGDNISDPKKVLYRKFTVGSGWDVGTTNVSNTIGNGSYSTMDPCAIVDSQNNLHLVWKDYQPGNKEIFYKKCTAGIWDETPLNLSETANASDTPSISIDGQDNLSVAWAEKTDGIYYDVVVLEYSQANGLWSAATNISNTPGSDSRYPNLPAFSGQDLACIWTEGESSLYDIVCWYDPQTSAVSPQPVAKARLYANHPNPFNPRTTVSFSINRTQNVELCIFDMTGKRVVVLVDQLFQSGTHSVTWQGTDTQGKAVSSGTYLVKMITDGVVASEKMTLLR